MSERGRDGGGEAPEAMEGEDLVSLLYGELPAEEAERTGARVASDPTLSARFGEMRRVRDLFASLEDEEPPARLSAQLMAEAARAAPQPRRAAAAPQAGFWARFVSWLQPLVQRPALAAAASLVLVAGVAGVLYMKKGEELTSTAPPAAETASELEGTQAGATGDPAASTPVTAANEAPADSTGADDGDDRNAEEEAAPAVPEPSKESSRADQATAKRRKSPSSGKSADTGKNAYDDKAPAKPAVKSGTVYGLSEQEMVQRQEAKGESSEGGGGVVGGAEADSNSKADAPPPAPPASAPAPADEPKPTPRVNVRDLHKRAIDAALDNRCTEVRSLAGQVKTSDSSYYAKSFASDGRLKSCLSPQKTAPAKKK